MFVGRESDLAGLMALWRKRASSLAVVSGRRRIGKSTLVERFAADSKCRFIEIAGLAPDHEMTNQKQLDHFCERLAGQTGVPEVKVDGWAKAFDLLATAIKGSARTVVFLDEISWMGHFDSSFAAFLKDAWDLHFAKRPNLVLVLAGSVSAWIQQNILNSKAFVGRIWDSGRQSSRRLHRTTARDVVRERVCRLTSSSRRPSPCVPSRSSARSELTIRSSWTSPRSCGD